ncbi:MAG: hypothetical protein Q9P01_10450 [Anaerolineae bacterium]|nr:hypothetical protein [Anaerolineae bacterium]MDQ7035228.1 hypothetical protein [Anaerolineae bacterium]
MAEQPGLDGQFLLDEYARYRRWGALLVLGGLALLFIVGAWLSTRTTIPLSLDYDKLGVHLMLDDGHNNWSLDIWDEHLAAADAIASPGGIAVQLIRADDLNPERWQVFMDLAAEHDLTPVIRLATTFDRDRNLWTAPTADSEGRYTTWGEDYAAFLNALEWTTAEKHIILLNEPNNGREWGGQPDAIAYAQFVVDVAAVLREQVDGVVILNGALDLVAPNTGSEPFPDSDLYMIDANSFMDAMNTAQPNIFALFDKWNSHVYPLGAFTEPPSIQEYRFDFLQDAVDTTTTPPENIYNRGINSYAWELWKLEQFGISDISVMITEFGWRHAESTNPDALDGGENYPDADLVAQYVDMALRGTESPFAETVTWQPLLADERVEAIALFALNGVPRDWGHTNWLQLDSEGAIIGTYMPYDLIVGYTP